MQEINRLLHFIALCENLTSIEIVDAFILSLKYSIQIPEFDLLGFTLPRSQRQGILVMSDRCLLSSILCELQLQFTVFVCLFVFKYFIFFVFICLFV